jgi:hypothetical protein
MKAEIAKKLGAVEVGMDPNLRVEVVVKGGIMQLTYPVITWQAVQKTPGSDMYRAPGVKIPDLPQSCGIKNDPVSEAWRAKYSGESVYFDEETRFLLIFQKHSAKEYDRKVHRIEATSTQEWHRDNPVVRDKLQVGDRFIWLSTGAAMYVNKKDYSDLCDIVWRYTKQRANSPFEGGTYTDPNLTPTKEGKPMILEEGEIAVAILEKKSADQTCPNPGWRMWAPYDHRSGYKYVVTRHQYIVKTGFNKHPEEGRNKADAMSVLIQCRNCGVRDKVLVTHGSQQSFGILQALKRYGARDPFHYLDDHNELPNGKTIIPNKVRGISGKDPNAVKYSNPLVSLLTAPIVLPWRGLRAVGQGTKKLMSWWPVYLISGLPAAGIGIFFFVTMVNGCIEAERIENCNTPKIVGIVKQAQHVGDHLFLTFENEVEQRKLRTKEDQKDIPRAGDRGYICKSGHYHMRATKDAIEKSNQKTEQPAEEKSKTEPKPKAEPESEPEAEDFQEY